MTTPSRTAPRSTASRSTVVRTTTVLTALAAMALAAPTAAGSRPPAATPEMVTTAPPAAPAPTPSAAPTAAPSTASPDAASPAAAAPAAGLPCTTTATGLVLCGHGEDPPPPPPPAGTGPVEVLGGEAALPCHGDGQGGPRVRTVYARPEGTADRFAAALPSFTRWAAAVDRDVAASAARTGGRRHVRFATTPGPDCALAVVRLTLPAAAFRSFAATVDALHARGLSRPDAKYLVWADATELCGIATMYADDSAGPGNLNDGGGPAYARVDRRCWGSVETHEVVHMLGGVQRSARNATQGYHCRDGHDVMCYDDGTPGAAQRAVCPGSAARLLDCGGDDYFSTAPARGSYLATHWNTARSSFLSTAAHEPPPAAPSARRPSPSPTPSPSPSGLVRGVLDALPTSAR